MEKEKVFWSFLVTKIISIKRISYVIGEADLEIQK
jgi:hypothetical protein